MTARVPFAVRRTPRPGQVLSKTRWMLYFCFFSVHSASAYLKNERRTSSSGKPINLGRKLIWNAEIAAAHDGRNLATERPCPLHPSGRPSRRPIRSAKI